MNQGKYIFAVMPQNEFNSAQTFPSCCWTAAGLADFIGSYPGPAMEELGVDIYFGTMERPAEELVDTVLQDERSGKYMKGIGFQWAGKESLPGIYKRYPYMKLYQTEQECGDGKNDWRGAMYSWELMKHASHFVLPGAKKLGTDGAYDDVLAFRNPDNSVVVIIANQMDEPRATHIKVGDLYLSPELAANSINTYRITY